jgi:hypothetical protein
MLKTFKTVVLPPNSAVVITAKQFAWISAVSSVDERLPQKVELSVVSKLNKKPIALVNVLSKKELTNEEKTFVRDVIKPKVDRIASTILEMSFKLILKGRMLQENGISDSELFEHFPSIPQWVVLFNNTQEEVEVEIPEKFVIPKIVTASLV